MVRGVFRGTAPGPFSPKAMRHTGTPSACGPTVAAGRGGEESEGPDVFCFRDGQTEGCIDMLEEF